MEIRTDLNDIVIITNRFGHEYEVTRERAEALVKNGDITFKDIAEIETPMIEKVVTKTPTLDIKEKIIEETKETTKIVEVSLNDLTLEELRIEYLTAFGKEITPRYKNDAEYIKTKLLTK